MDHYRAELPPSRLTAPLDVRVLRFLTEPQHEEPALLAQALVESGRYEEAIELARKGLEQDPTDADLRLVHGVALAAQGRLEEAQLAFIRLAECAPDWADGWRYLAEVLLRRRRPEQALAVVERALILDPSNTELQSLRRGASLMARAARFTLRPDSEEPALLAQELFELGWHAEALAVTRSALVLELDDPDLLVAHARAARALGDLDEAASALHTASFEAADWTALWLLLAEVEHARGELASALTAARRGAALAPRDAELGALVDRLEREHAHHAEIGLASVIVELS